MAGWADHGSLIVFSPHCKDCAFYTLSEKGFEYRHDISDLVKITLSDPADLRDYLEIVYVLSHYLEIVYAKSDDDHT